MLVVRPRILSTIFLCQFLNLPYFFVYTCPGNCCIQENYSGVLLYVCLKLCSSPMKGSVLLLCQKVMICIIGRWHRPSGVLFRYCFVLSWGLITACSFCFFDEPRVLGYVMTGLTNSCWCEPTLRLS